MIKNNGRDFQLSFDFETENKKVKFITIKGQCRCGYSQEYKKADVVIEMTVSCPKCRSIIKIK